MGATIMSYMSEQPAYITAHGTTYVRTDHARGLMRTSGPRGQPRDRQLAYNNDRLSLKSMAKKLYSQVNICRYHDEIRDFAYRLRRFIERWENDEDYAEFILSLKDDFEIYKNNMSELGAMRGINIDEKVKEVGDKLVAAFLNMMDERVTELQPLAPPQFRMFV